MSAPAATVLLGPPARRPPPPQHPVLLYDTQNCLSLQELSALFAAGSKCSLKNFLRSIKPAAVKLCPNRQERTNRPAYAKEEQPMKRLLLKKPTVPAFSPAPGRSLFPMPSLSGRTSSPISTGIWRREAKAHPTGAGWAGPREGRLGTGVNRLPDGRPVQIPNFPGGRRSHPLTGAFQRHKIRSKTLEIWHLEYFFQEKGAGAWQCQT